MYTILSIVLFYAYYVFKQLTGSSKRSCAASCSDIVVVIVVVEFSEWVRFPVSGFGDAAVQISSIR